MSARERILERLRRQTQTSSDDTRPPAGGKAPLPGDPEAFITALTTAHAEVHALAAEEWPDHLAELAEARDWGPLWIGQDAASRQWQAHPAGRSSTVLSNWASQKEALFREATVGLTQARAGITETGTLLVDTGPETPRTLSLIPPINVIVVDRSTLLPDLETALAHYGAGTISANRLLISGPSKTADIQQTLAYGAHGPRELVVYLTG